MKPEKHHFVRVDFHHFRAFESFTLHLKDFNVLVGPNNAGKSTILVAFRILHAAMRKAASRNPDLVRGPAGTAYGYHVDLRPLAIAEENIFYNYNDSEPATVCFRISNGNTLTLHFSESGSCVLIPSAAAKAIRNTTTFCNQFNCPIGFVPILGPVEERELLYDKEAARLALFNYRAARNFRNIWHHYPERFEDFRLALSRSWPGMDVERPQVKMSGEHKPTLYMLCPEERIPREIFWAGFGFQVWCQMLTHLIQSTDKALFLIDEPDIYLHSVLQRQLVALLRELGPDILIATHSTEIITEVNPDDIVVVNKRARVGKRIASTFQLSAVFGMLGSHLNPVLTQLAKTKRVVFVEGKDFQIVGRFARKLGVTSVESRAGFAVVPVEGFNPERIRNLKLGMEATLGSPIMAAAILDRDFRCHAERESLVATCREFCDLAVIFQRKEIENFVLIPSAIDRAAAKRSADRARRVGRSTPFAPGAAADALAKFAESQRSYVTSQTLTCSRRFERARGSTADDATIMQAVLDEFEQVWATGDAYLSLIPGKDALSAVNQQLQARFDVNVSATGIIDAMSDAEVPDEMKSLIQNLGTFAATTRERSLGENSQG